MALVTLATVKTRLNISGTAEDALLTALISQVEALVKNSVGYPIESATYTRYFDGTGTPWLPLPFRPVTSVTSVHLDDSGYWGQGDTPFDSSTALTEGTDYALRMDPNDPSGNASAGLIYRINGVWPRPFRRSTGLLSPHVLGPLAGAGNIKVVFVAGYTSIPQDIQLAVCDVVALARIAAPYGGLLNSESYDGYSYSLVGQSAQAAFLGYLGSAGGMILNRYRRIVC